MSETVWTSGLHGKKEPDVEADPYDPDDVLHLGSQVRLSFTDSATPYLQQVCCKAGVQTDDQEVRDVCFRTSCCSELS